MYDSDMDRMEAAAEREFAVYQKQLDKLGDVIDRRQNELFEVTRERDEARAELTRVREAAQRVIDARENLPVVRHGLISDYRDLQAALDALTFALTDEPTEADHA